jgi:hypothetical protein
MDVNEEIIVEWLHLCKQQFTIEDIKFKVPHNYSDIDILAVDKNGNYYDYEIKWRSAYSVGKKSEKEEINEFIYSLLRKERIKRINEIIGNKPVNHIIISTYKHFGKSEDKRKRIIRRFNKKKIKVLFFEDIVPELYAIVKLEGRYDSPVLQTIRMLKYFKL